MVWASLFLQQECINSFTDFPPLWRTKSWEWWIFETLNVLTADSFWWKVLEEWYQSNTKSEEYISRERSEAKFILFYFWNRYCLLFRRFKSFCKNWKRENVLKIKSNSSRLLFILWQVILWGSWQITNWKQASDSRQSTVNSRSNARYVSDSRPWSPRPSL